MSDTIKSDLQEEYGTIILTDTAGIDMSVVTA